MSAFDLLVKGGTAVLPDGPQRVDVGVRDGRFTAIAPTLDGPAAETIDARGQLLFPGFIDAHTHMGIPIKDTSSADDFDSGSVAAACGGVTTIIDFTVQSPGQSLHESVAERRGKADGRSHVDYAIHVNITDRPEKRLAEIPDLVAAGYNSFKVFSTYREAGMMIAWDQFRAVLQAIHDEGGLLLLHAEDNETVERLTARHIAAGRRAPLYHARSRPAEAEAKAVAQATAIAGELGAALYIVHLSSAAGLASGLAARERGVNVHLETCPQYLLLDESRYEGEDGRFYITTPPLRTPADQAALWAAIGNGQIDTVGTDHCPFTIAQKNRGGDLFYQTPNGLPGVETLFPLLYTAGVAAGRIDLARLVELLAANPARLFGIDERKGAIRAGGDADLVVWDPRVETTVRAAALHGRADWSPYEGQRLAGQVRHTILRGQFLVRDGRFTGDAARGQWLPGRRLG